MDRNGDGNNNWNHNSDVTIHHTDDGIYEHNHIHDHQHPDNRLYDNESNDSNDNHHKLQHIDINVLLLDLAYLYYNDHNVNHDQFDAHYVHNKHGYH